MMARSRIEAARLDVIDKSRPTEIVVASKPIHAGDPFSPGNLAKKTIPVSGTGKRNIKSEDFNLLLTAKSKSEIDPGEPVLWTDVDEPFEAAGFSEMILPGHMALTLEAGSTSSFSGLVRTGDRIDFLCKSTNEWIRRIQVLSIDRHYNRSGAREPAEEVSTMTLSVTSQEGAKLSSCSREGTLSWFLRNPTDNTIDLFPASSKSSNNSIEIWKGGIPEPALLQTWSKR